MKIPTNLISGFLGVGKTTAILDLLARKGQSGRWAVLVNEFGQVGIDGARLQASGVMVREVAGGCICCAAQLPLKVALTRLLREVRPERLIIEPTGVGHPAGIIDALRDAWLAPHIELRSVITLVDPQQFADARLQALKTYRDQLALADVLVINRCDLATPAQVQRCLAALEALYPPKLDVACTQQGRLDPDWLDLAYGEVQASWHPAHDEVGCFVSRSLRFEPEVVFHRERLSAWFEALASDARILRAKGVLRVGRDWQDYELAGGQLTVAPITWRRDSRVEVVAQTPAPDWAQIEAALTAARMASPG
ncbi:CobW family GTP-binding protein [Thiobacter aerophilum]|uniref:CobW family GTP-binding protein n=1 Tax=Thiobacter aerophilum TaxID=3121275 RepID=A0ABV0ECC6_9BURK